MPRKRRSKPLSPEQGALGDAIEELIKKTGVKRDTLADAAGVSERRIGDYIRGRGNPRYKTLLRIFAALGVTPGEIMTRADEIQRELSQEE
ncbi:MAG TPA: helix-turn-helix transcriptional regulator [Solirubrobacteraceae bacterium]|jgi:transcriptional regulator with XRE-family HTH domain